MSPRASFGVALALGVCAASCSPTIVRTGLPAGRTPELYDDRWHHGLVFGLADASGAYDIDRICPDGWSEVRVETPAGLVILQLVTLGMYTPSRVTIVCAATIADPPEPAGEGPVPE